ncbi:MAG: sigma-70 family RNA polymerase sigma factor [Acidimicrobiia bacterium]|nr:sigma-70 family RNA polymerase sigma factor [Acidimicrobiia bacterium]
MTFNPWQSLLDSARAGGDWAWAEIYHRYAPRVRGYAVSQGVADPDNLVGEVFLQAVRNLATFTGDEGSFRSWLFTIAHRRVLDDRRRVRRRPEELTGVPPDAATEPAAEDRALDRIGSDWLRQGLESLTTDQSRVLALRVIADLSIGEVAEVVGKRPGAVKALQHRAIERLRKTLKEPVSK